MATKIAPIFGPAAGTVQWLRDCIERGKREVHTQVCLITPGLAAVMLDNNPNNRSLKWKRELYASDMRNGRWVFNGEPLIFAQDGTLNDGQNRLHAVIDANSPQQFLCVFGVTRESRMTVDQGAVRGPGDYLAMGGAKNANNVAAIAKAVLGYERGGGQRLDVRDLTPSEITERGRSDAAITTATEYAVGVYRYTKPFAAPQIVGAAFYILSDVHPVEAREYMDAVCIGEGLKRYDPPFTVRETLLSMGKAGTPPKLEVILRGWVAYRQRRTLKIAKVLGTFPAVI